MCVCVCLCVCAGGGGEFMRPWFPTANDVLESVERRINTSCLLSDDGNLI